MKEFHIILVEPQIPQNTGNIGRLCVALNARLHLIYPLGFDISQKEVRRAGLDYWQNLKLKTWENLESFWEKNRVDSKHFFLSTKAQNVIFDAPLQNGGFLYFGREDAGLPKELLKKYANQSYKLPMIKGVRSINLATSVGAVLYEGVRQAKLYISF